MMQHFSLTAISSTVLLVLLALFAGAIVPFQAGANSALARSLAHPLWGTLVSLLVSLLVVGVTIAILRVPMPTFSALQGMPAWIWFGGVAGVVYISLTIVLTPKLGMTTFFIMVIAGQMLASMVIDHWGLMGLAIKPVNPGRLLGAVLVGCGVIVSVYASSVSAVEKLAS